VEPDLRGETNLPAPIVRALLQHFEHSHAVHNRWHSVATNKARCSWSRRSAKLLMRLAFRLWLGAGGAGAARSAARAR